MTRSQAADFEGFSDYLGESSSFKVNTVTVDGRSQNEGYIVNQSVTTTVMPGAWFTSPAFDYVEGTYSSGYGGAWVYNAFTADTAWINSVTHKRSVIFLRDPGIWIVTDRMTASDAATHAYRTIWKFPGYSASLKCYGFETSQFSGSSNPRQIYTTDPDGPNIHLYQLGPTALTYRSYAGERDPYLGWYGSSQFGVRVAATDVHLLWSGAGTQLLVNLIAPSDTGHASPVMTIRTNASTATSLNVEFDLENGHTVKLVQRLQAQTLAVGNRTLTANTIVNDVGPDGRQQGLALGATGFADPNFSFAASPSSFVPMERIGVPTSFQWSNESGWLVPATAGDYTWGGAVSAVWTNQSNWSGGVKPGNTDTAYFGSFGAGRTAPAITTAQYIGSINISGAAGYTFTQGGNVFWLNQAVPLSSTSPAGQTFDVSWRSRMTAAPRCSMRARDSLPSPVIS